jgi:hypothetical protein
MLVLKDGCREGVCRTLLKVKLWRMSIGVRGDHRFGTRGLV